MRSRHVAAVVILLVSLAQSSCFTVFEYDTLDTSITVTRVSDGTVVADTLVRVRYHDESWGYLFKFNKPSDVQGITDASGNVVLPIADFRWGIEVETGTDAESPDFGTASAYLSADQIRVGGEFRPRSWKVAHLSDEPLQIVFQRPAL